MILKQTLISLGVGALLAGCGGPPTTGNFRHQGYLLDSAGNNAVVKSLGYDACVRTSDWTPARAVIECDPDLVPKPVAKAPPAPPPAPKVAPPPAPKVAPPQPEPKPVVQRFSLSTDMLFDFDKATLRPEGRTKLDEISEALRGTQYETIVVTGHTDRAGSVAYNQRLSEQRANAVKRYLEGKGLEVGKITAIGKGKSETKINPPLCREPGLTRAQIFACLEPDRRVIVEATGSKTVAPGAAASKAAPSGKPEARPEAAPDAKAAAGAAAKAKEAIKPKPKTPVGF